LYRRKTAFFALALGLFLLHEAYHLFEDFLGMGPLNPIGALYGVSDVGHEAHVLTGLVVALALAAALWGALRPPEAHGGPSVSSRVIEAQVPIDPDEWV